MMVTGITEAWASVGFSLIAAFLCLLIGQDKLAEEPLWIAAWLVWWRYFLSSSSAGLCRLHEITSAMVFVGLFHF